MRPLSRGTTSGLIAALALLFCVPGCIFVRTTEHRIRLNEDGSGQALLRLIDLRSDAPDDSLVTRDFTQLMAAYNRSNIEEFEKQGRKIIKKEFSVHADSLILEITYIFPKPESIEGLRITKGDVHMVVGEGREILGTNGTVKAERDSTQQISWSTDARSIVYVIRDKVLPLSKSLTPWYQHYHN